MKISKLIPLILTFAGAGVLVGLVVLRIFNTSKPTAGLKIDTTPPALVFVNNVQVGRTPLDQMFPPGDVSVKIVPESTTTTLSTYQTNVTLTNKVYTVIRHNFNESDSLSSGEIIGLVPQSDNTASLNVISSDPDSASVVVDNDPQGFTPLTVASITPADHHIEISAPGYETTTLSAKAVNGYRLTINVKLAAKQQAPPVIPPGLIQLTPTATPSAVIKPTPTVTSSQVKILTTPTGFLRVRKTPGINAPEIGRVNPGDTFTLLQAQTGWFEIQGTFTATDSGWISSQYATKL